MPEPEPDEPLLLEPDPDESLLPEPLSSLPPPGPLLSPPPWSSTVPGVMPPGSVSFGSVPPEVGVVGMVGVVGAVVVVSGRVAGGVFTSPVPPPWSTTAPIPTNAATHSAAAPATTA